MSEKPFMANFFLTNREFLTILIIVVNAFTWYFVAFNVLKEILSSASLMACETAIIWSIHFIGVAGAVLVGAILSSKIISRDEFLYLWMFLGILFSLAPIVVGTASIVSLSVISFLWGVSFGLGLPSCMGYYADYTAKENRGRSGGIIFLFIGIGMFLLGTVVTPILTAESVILAIWRGLGFVAFLFLKPKKRHVKAKKNPSYASILRNRPFLLYFVPWIMFCLVNYLTAPLYPSNVARVLTLVENAIAGLFALVGGLLSDWVGRKRVVVVGFVLLGIGYAVLGVFPETMILWYFYTAVDGVAWGVFGAIFLMVLWGDLSGGMMPEKYYAVGGMPFLLSAFLQLMVAPYIAEKVPTYATFSFASFFLFLAVLPLMYAPETLPEKKIQLRKLRKYVGEAKKKVEKEHARKKR